ncbi:hypothetical protein BKN38_04935 [Helicobacter sp. CLO-3]|uniref:hypothetical protein n=1 Tax=unclassified Helicobacter TaxID=2593540 RepID=UPI000805016C|nr:MULTISPECIES: hypothetical protein [unclassified Helicobacter]OBV29873.1 hypothetical protein BA723_03700 [Helicobacter sp. CLO-3]OHU83677.1 hypothetical protein BKN38_04935 [Helicobacter sp. CLO-3]
MCFGKLYHAKAIAKPESKKPESKIKSKTALESKSKPESKTTPQIHHQASQSHPKQSKVT